MYAEKQTVTITTDASGDGSGYTEPVTGRVLAIHYVKGDYAAGVDLDITTEDMGEEIWDEDDVNASKSVYPRAQVHDTVGAGRTYDGTRPVAEPIVVAGERIKIVVANGGDTKSGTFHVIVG